MKKRGCTETFLKTPLTFPVDDAERAQAVLVHEPEDRTLTEGSKTTSSVRPPVVPQQHPGCPQCRHFLQEHPDFLSKLRGCASRNAHLIPDLMALLDNFENLRLGHVELIHRPHNGRYAELFRYFKNATTVVMSDRYAVKEEWQRMFYAIPGRSQNFGVRRILNAIGVPVLVRNPERRLVGTRHRTIKSPLCQK